MRLIVRHTSKQEISFVLSTSNLPRSFPLSCHVQTNKDASISPLIRAFRSCYHMMAFALVNDNPIAPRENATGPRRGGEGGGGDRRPEEVLDDGCSDVGMAVGCWTRRPPLQSSGSACIRKTHLCEDGMGGDIENRLRGHNYKIDSTFPHHPQDNITACFTLYRPNTPLRT